MVTLRYHIQIETSFLLSLFLAITTTTKPPHQEARKKNKNDDLIIGGSVGGGILLLGVIVAIGYMVTRKRARPASAPHYEGHRTDPRGNPSHLQDPPPFNIHRHGRAHAMHQKRPYSWTRGGLFGM